MNCHCSQRFPVFGKTDASFSTGRAIPALRLRRQPLIAQRWRSRPGVRQIYCKQNYRPLGAIPNVRQESEVASAFKAIVGDRYGNVDEKHSCAQSAMRIWKDLPPRDVVNIFHSCKAGGYINLELFDCLSKRMLSSPLMVERLSALHMSMMLNSLGCLSRNKIVGSDPSSNFSKLMDVLIRESLTRERLRDREYNDRSIANVVQGLGYRFFTHGAPRTPKDCTHLLDVMFNKVSSKGRVEDIKPQEFVHMFHACAMMKYRNAKAFEKLCDEIASRIQITGFCSDGVLGFKLDHLSRLMLAFSKLEYFHQDVLDAFGSIIDANPHDFSERDISNLIYGFGLLNYTHERALSGLSVEIANRVEAGLFNDKDLVMLVYGLGKLQFRDEECLSALGSAVVEHPRLERLKERELSNIMYGFGANQFCERHVMLAMSEELAKPERLRRFKECDLAMIMHSFGQLGFCDDNAWNAINMEIVKPERLANLKDQELSMVWYCYGRLRWTDEDVLDAVSDEIRDPRRMAKFHPISLSNIMYACGQLEFRDMDLLNKVGVELIKPGSMTAISNQGLANVIYGCGQLEYVNETMLDALCKEVVKPARLNGFVEQDISTMVYGFGQLKYLNEEVLDALSGEICQPYRLERFTEQGLANILYGFGMLGYQNQDVMTALTSEICGPTRMSQLKPQELAMAIYALGQLSFYSKTVLDTLAQELGTQHRLESFSEQHLSNILYGMGQLQYANLDFLARFGMEIVRSMRLGKFSEQGLANIVYSYGQLEHLDDYVMDEISMEISRAPRLQSFNEQELANIVYGFGQLGYTYPMVMSALCGEIGKEGRLRELKEQALCNIVHGFGRLGYTNKLFMYAMCREIQNRANAGALQEQHLSSLVYSFGKLGFFDGQLVSVLLHTISPEICQYQPRHVSSIVYGLALLWNCFEFEFVFEWIEPFLDRIAKGVVGNGRLGEFNMQGVTNLCWGLSKLQYYDKTLMDASVDQFLVLHGDGTAILEEHLMVVKACAILNHHNEVLFETAIDWLNDNMSSIASTQCICNMLWSLSVLDVLHPSLFEKLCGRLINVLPDSGPENVEQCYQIMQAWLYIQSVATDMQFDDQIDLIVAKAKERVKDSPPQSSSALEKSVLVVLSELGVEMASQMEIGDSYMVVDAVLVGFDPPIVLEVDGPVHYTINEVGGEFRQLGYTVFRNKNIERSGHKVVCVPYYKWNEMDMQQRKEWMASAISKV